MQIDDIFHRSLRLRYARGYMAGLYALVHALRGRDILFGAERDSQTNEGMRKADKGGCGKRSDNRDRIYFRRYFQYNTEKECLGLQPYALQCFRADMRALFRFMAAPELSRNSVCGFDHKKA